MKIKIWAIDRLKDKFEINYTEDFSYLRKEIDQIREISSVKVVGAAYKIAEFYKIKGTISLDLQFQCSRCLNHFNHHLEGDFDELFVPKDVETNIDLYEDDNIHLLDSVEIDLAKIIEDTIVFNIPYIPFCSEECKGLCPICGINLNEETCNCKSEQLDPRMDDLAKWFDRSNNKE